MPSFGMTRALTPALAGYDIHWWHIALAGVVAVAAAVGLYFGGRRALPYIQQWSRTQQIVAAVAAVLVLAGGAYAIYKALERPGDVLDRNATFHKQKKKPKPQHKGKPERVNWPVYGYNSARTRYLPSDRVNPPFHGSDWSFQAGSLLEFSPITAGRNLYFLDKNATLYALNDNSGKVIWKHRVGTLSAASPAYADGRLFAVTLQPGQVMALGLKHGQPLWKHTLPGRSETSPVTFGKSVIIGCECGKVYAFDQKSGKLRWTVSTGSAVKGGVAIHNGTAFFGNYGGELYAVNAANGAVKWNTATSGGSFGRSGAIYSTPAVAFGRVYVGSIDGRVYSYEESTGHLAWSHSTGAEVYAAPAVADTPEAPPLVFIGSADKHIYALDARTGAVRWQHFINGIILGAASVVGKTVYVAGIGPNIGTFGFSAKTGNQIYENELGEYNPVISDGQRIFLTGTSNVRSFTPFTPNEKKLARKRAAAKKKRQHQAHERKLKRRREAKQKQGGKQSQGGGKNHHKNGKGKSKSHG